VQVPGLLDESAHLATAWRFLAAFLPKRDRALLLWVLLGSVVIDVDHVPLYRWHLLAAGPGSRPVTHFLATVVRQSSSVRTLCTPAYARPRSWSAPGSVSDPSCNTRLK
jgi:hypothetical protein